MRQLREFIKQLTAYPDPLFITSRFRCTALVVLFSMSIVLSSCQSSSQPEINNTANGTNRIELSAEEEQFIEEHPVIRTGVDPEFIPYEFIDTDGAYKGISEEYQQLIEERTGLVFEPVMGLTWAQAYEMAVEGKIDVLPSVSKTPIREQYFLFSEPYYTFQRAIYLQEETKNLSSIEDLSNKTVAVQANSSHHTYLMSSFPSITLSLYNDVPSAIQAVSDGQELAFIGNFATTNYLIKSSGITGLNYIRIKPTADGSQSLYFAVSKDMPLLVGIINRALQDIGNDERISIDNKWLGVESTADYTLFFQILNLIVILIVIILAVSSFWIIRLRKEVSIRKMAQEEMLVAKEDAVRANEIKSLFLARMSHEIRTPLNAITGMSYLMKKTALSPTQGIYVEKLTQASKNMLGIINDILDFSKIEAGKIDLENVSFSLDKLLQRVISITSVKVQEQGIQFDFERDPLIPSYFFGDPVRIEQILMNLLNNAIKFTPAGKVTLSLSLYSRVKNSCRIHFSIADTGIGMSEEDKKRMFTAFDQADSSISRRFGGTGLGLSIVKNLTEMMGGRIIVESEPGKGSTFLVELPFDVDAEAEATQEKTMSADCFRTVRCLVIDKNEDSRKFLHKAFDSFGVYAESATSEEDALHMLRKAWNEERQYNLLIIDCNTLDKEDFAGVSALKQLSIFDKLPKVIGLAPLSREDLLDQAASLGLDATLIRPIIPSILYNQIIELFEIVSPAYVADKKSSAAVVSYPYSLLLVEDNKTNQFIARSILEQAGFRMAVANDGLEGYEYFLQHRDTIDLILMDLHMPVMDGYTSAGHIREVDSKVPIVAMTADAVSGIDEMCRINGMTHYVSKPFDPDELITTIQQVAREYRGEPGEDKAAESALLSDINSPVKSSDDFVDLPASRNQSPDTGLIRQVSLPTAGALNIEDGLKRIGGDRELYRLILSEYRNENSEIPENLEKAVVSRDFLRAGDIVHKIKSSSGTIGAMKLFNLAADLQKALKAEDEALSDSLSISFAENLRQVLSEIDSFLSRAR